MSSAEPVHIAITPYDLTDDYNRHAGALLLSVLDNCSRQAAVHIIYNKKLCSGKEKETEYNKSCYQKIADRYGAELHYHHIEIPSWTNSVERVKRFTEGSLCRLYLHRLLADIDRVIYFDCDIVVNTDITPLWNLQLHDTPLAACLDTQIQNICRKSREAIDRAGISVSNYFNSGMLVLNLKQLRESDKKLSEALHTFLHDNPEIGFPDQDFLNWYCSGNYTEADEKYNIFSRRKDAGEFIDDCIIHYSGDIKPWKTWGGPADIFYWEYLRKTPWCEDIRQFYTYFRQIPNLAADLPLLESDFFKELSGTGKEKMCYAAHFMFCIIKSGIKRLLKKENW